jgi:hypothetical protein
VNKFRAYLACVAIMFLSSLLLSGPANAETLPSGTESPHKVADVCDQLGTLYLYPGSYYDGYCLAYHPTPYGQCTRLTYSVLSGQNLTGIDQYVYTAPNCTGDAYRLCGNVSTEGCLTAVPDFGFYPNSIGG